MQLKGPNTAQPTSERAQAKIKAIEVEAKLIELKF